LLGLPHEEWGGVGRPYSYHPQFTNQEAVEFRDQVLEREYHDLGPSLLRWVRTDLKGYRRLNESDNPNLRRRAEHLAGKMSNHRALLWAVARLVPTPEMREMTEELAREVEKTFGPTTAREKTEGLGLLMFGLKQKLRYRLIGDVIQPPTTVTRYPAMN